MQESQGLRCAAAALLLLVAANADAQCGPISKPISQPGTFPSLVAGPIATNGTVLGLARSDTGSATPAVFFTIFDSNLNQISADRQIADASANGAAALVWNGTEFALFYQAPSFTLIMQRIDASGNPIGSAVPIANHPPSVDDEFDVIWSPIRNAYALFHTVNVGPDRGLYLTFLSATGSVVSDTLFSLFIATPSIPRIAALPDGSFALVWMRSGSDARLLALTVFSPTGGLKSATISERTVTGARVSTNGTSILVIFSSMTASGGTELRYAQFDLAGNITKADSSFLTGAGIDILPLNLQWNPTLSEYVLTYDDAAFGLQAFPGEIRIRRFVSPTATASDTLLSPNPANSRLVAPFPIVFLGGGYIGSIQRVISRSDGSESYLTRLCPFFVTAAADRIVSRPFVPITFTAASSGGAPGFIFDWQFGDNDIARGAVVQHVYQLPGTYTVTLTGTDAAGALSITRLTVQIVAVPVRQRAVRH